MSASWPRRFAGRCAVVACIPPVNEQVIKSTLGEKAVAHVARNASLVQGAFEQACGPRGTVVNAIFDSPPEEYIDPVHLNPAGRLRYASRIAEAARPYLGDSDDAM